ncbi:putative insecticial toxin [Yersinia pseudotuberculosis]|nr:putative insecticial toxin [Yersinia pseudotuberculosis]
MYKALKLDVSNLEKSKIQLKDKKKEEEIKLKQAKTNLQALNANRKSEIINRLSKIYHWDTSLTSEIITLVFDGELTYSFESIVLLKENISIAKKLNISAETLVKIKDYIYNYSYNELENITNKLNVNI